MPRIRYLKPEFFKDEDLKELPFEARLFYQGLWCHADREGRGEDRPERLKIEIFPYDVDIDTEALMVLLAKPKNHSKRPFINRYTVGDNRYYEIVNWHKHQTPHHTEKMSTIPPYEPLDNGELTVIPPDLKRKSKEKEEDKEEEKEKGSLSFAGLKETDPSILKKQRAQKKQDDYTPEVREVRDYFYEVYRDKRGEAYGSLKPDQEREALKKLLDKGYSVADIKSLVDKFFTSNDDFITNSAYTILVFKATINQLSKEMKKKNDPLWVSQQIRKERKAQAASESPGKENAV